MGNHLEAFSRVFALCALASCLMGQTRLDDDPPLGAQERRYYPKRQDGSGTNSREAPVDNAGPAELSEPPLGHGYARKRPPAQKRGDTGDGQSPRVTTQSPRGETETRRERLERWRRAREADEVQPPLSRQK
jgi:hypothetical protein